MRPSRADWVPVACGVPVVAVAAVATMIDPLIGLWIVSGVVVLLACQTRPHAVASVLVVAALVMLRPGVASEYAALAGTGLVTLAALIAFVADIRQLRYPGPWAVAVGFLAAAYGCVLVLTETGGPPVGLVIQGFVTTVLAFAAIGMVAADRRRRLFIARGFVILVAAVGASYLVTFVLWCVAGFGSFYLGVIPLSRTGVMGGVFFPFTVTSGTQTVGTITFPRLTGIGREPGWMALWGIVAWFLWPIVQRKPRRLLRLLVIPAILGPVSSAGFEVFAVTVAYAWFLQPRPQLSAPAALGRFLFGLIAGGAALWIALFAPVFGFNDKSTYNATSFADRQTQVEEGLKALSVAPWGGTYDSNAGAINLVAAIAPNGILYVLLISAAVAVPILSRRRGRQATPVALAVLLTLVIAQPPGDSAVAYVLPALALLLSRDAASPVSAGAEPEVEEQADVEGRPNARSGRWARPEPSERREKQPEAA